MKSTTRYQGTHKTIIFNSCGNSVNVLLIFQSRLVTAIQIIVGGHVFAGGLATFFGNETWYEKYLMPALLRLTSPETGHRLAVKAARCGLMPRVKIVGHPELVCIFYHLDFACFKISCACSMSIVYIDNQQIFLSFFTCQVDQIKTVLEIQFSLLEKWVFCLCRNAVCGI